MKEEEAKTKWCPHVRPPTANEAVAPGDSNCIGSGCMMWEWEMEQKSHPDYYSPELSDNSGYCGLVK